ncbi:MULTISPECIES: O-antigen ligase [unclassified Virgibacillus]|uniref:O-antigen ligase family protein n=1 Tax=Virgibacillus TaxID=84406 RepID=UPI00090C68BD|nr:MULTISPECIES: O-antigen ligase family protein [unclassified Virgibacillus]API92973.1 hypothetical protein BKP57_14850 [Virgibacillus sp. 6R]MBS7428499.1 O-antigen ligase family protein [Virgibacillus sp. 19R1-5]
MRNINLSVKKILYIIIIYPFFKPYFFSTMGLMPYVNQALFAMSLILIVLLHLRKLPSIYINGGMCFILLFYTFTSISTFLNDSISTDFLSFMAFAIGFGLLLNYSLISKKDFSYFLFAIYFLLYIYVLTNLIAMFLFPNGIPSITDNIASPQYIFGNTNSAIKLLLPGLCFAFLYDLISFKKLRKRSWLLLILVWITVIKSWSVTAVFGLIIFTFIILYKNSGNKKFVLSYHNSLVFSLIIFLVLVVFRSENSFIVNIVEIFGKDVTFSNRDVLWLNAIDSIKSTPIWGYGYQSEDIIWKHIGNRYGSHNYYLDTMFRGGLISISFLILGLIVFGRNLAKQENTSVKRVLLGTCGAYFLMWIAEPFQSTEYLMLSILFVLISRLNIVVSYYYGIEKTTSLHDKIESREAQFEMVPKKT